LIQCPETVHSRAQGRPGRARSRCHRTAQDRHRKRNATGCDRTSSVIASPDCSSDLVGRWRRPQDARWLWSDRRPQSRSSSVSCLVACWRRPDAPHNRLLRRSSRLGCNHPGWQTPPRRGHRVPAAIPPSATTPDPRRDTCRGRCVPPTRVCRNGGRETSLLRREPGESDCCPRLQRPAARAAGGARPRRDRCPLVPETRRHGRSLQERCADPLKFSGHRGIWNSWCARSSGVPSWEAQFDHSQTRRPGAHRRAERPRTASGRALSCPRPSLGRRVRSSCDRAARGRRASTRTHARAGGVQPR
jgi:hypothetical protein